jgi:hypothetical protein
VNNYGDATVRCTVTGVRLRGYYPPWVPKNIPYTSIRSVRRVQIAALRGRARIWGSANPGLWANFDAARPRKKIALILNPFITPDDPDAVESVIRERAKLGPATEAPSRGPII